jgi:hypothetical protein
MEIDIPEIKKIYRKRISLFRDLLYCIDRERDYLINQDIKGLWSAMEEKQNILGYIELTKGHVQKIAGGEPAYLDIPAEDRQSVVNLSQTLLDLREEIKVRVTENVSFIKESLDFLHEIISTFTKAGQIEDSYGPAKNHHKESSRIYHSEV